MSIEETTRPRPSLRRPFDLLDGDWEFAIDDDLVADHPTQLSFDRRPKADLDTLQAATQGRPAGSARRSVTEPKGRWSVERAQEWAAQRPFALGVNFLPSTAVNSTEMWQAETFDPATIDRELGWASTIGFNSVRVFLQFLVHHHDTEAHLARLDGFFSIAAEHGMTVMPVLLDDCAFSGRQPHLGAQRPPVPGTHNSGWTPSPGHALVTDPERWDVVERYVRDVLSEFATDGRVLAWDLYNEPGNAGLDESSGPLLSAVFDWALDVRPSQPCTVGTWHPALVEMNETGLSRSDVVSFHSYEQAESVGRVVEKLSVVGRPVLCTEWLRRTTFPGDPAPERMRSTVESVLPVLRETTAGCFNWGLVNGRTQTHLPWGSAEGASDPTVWFHDLLDEHGRPHDRAEIELFRAASPRV